MKVLLLQVKTQTIYNDYDYEEVVNGIVPKSEWVDLPEDKIHVLERNILRTKHEETRYVLIKEVPDMAASIESMIEDQLKYEKEEKARLAKLKAEKDAKAAKAAAKRKKTDLEKKQAQLAKLQKELEVLKSSNG